MSVVLANPRCLWEKLPYDEWLSHLGRRVVESRTRMSKVQEANYDNKYLHNLRQ